MDRQDFMKIGFGALFGSFIGCNKKDKVIEQPKKTGVGDSTLIKKPEDNNVFYGRVDSVLKDELPIYDNSFANFVYNQTYQIIDIYEMGNSMSDMRGKDVDKRFIIFSHTPIQKRDAISFSFTPEDRITNKNIDKYLKSGYHASKKIFEHIDINSIDGVINNYNIIKRNI